MARLCWPAWCWVEARCHPARPVPSKASRVEVVKQVPVQHPRVRGVPSGGVEWGVVRQKRKPPSTQASWSPAGDPASPASAEQLWPKRGSAGRRRGRCVTRCTADLFFFSLLADPRGPPPSPSLRATAGQRVPAWDVPPFPGSRRGMRGCGGGRRTERFGKRFGNGSWKSFARGRGQRSSRRAGGPWGGRR